jgi:hypothetical protein
MKRTPKLVIVARISAIPLAIVLFWASLFGTVNVQVAVFLVLGGVGALVLFFLLLWGITNLGTYLSDPTNYRIWKSGGGDPFFDTVDSPFNNDPPSVRYAELYQERLRQELGPQLQPPDTTRGIDDPSIL